MSTDRIATFEAFYPYYLKEHQLRSTRVLHFVGTSLFFICLLLCFWTLNAWWLLAGFISGYLFAWIGHFFFEKNKPATFKYPVWSLLADFKLYFQLLAGVQKF